MTRLVAHSAWGIVTPEICGARFRQGTAGERDGAGSGLSGGSVALVALRSHLSSRRGAMAVGSRWRSSWVMASTSYLVRLPLRSNSSTKAAFSHMVEMASSSRVTRWLWSRGSAMLLHPSIGR